MYECSTCRNYVSDTPGLCPSCSVPMIPMGGMGSNSTSGDTPPSSDGQSLALVPWRPQSSSVPRSMSRQAFTVNSLSLTNDLSTSSSDMPTFMIARDVQIHPAFPTTELIYARNPTATQGSLALVREDRTPGTQRLVNFLAYPAPNEEVMFVIRRDGQLIFGTRPHDVRRPHPTLVGQPDPSVLTGGTITMRDGLIYEVRDDSGHFQPGSMGVDALLQVFSRLPPSLYHHNFQGFKPFGGPTIIPDFVQADIEGRNYQALRRDASALLNRVQNRIDNTVRSISRPQVAGNADTLRKILAAQDPVNQEIQNFMAAVTAFFQNYLASSNARLAQQAIYTAQRLSAQLQQATANMNTTDAQHTTLEINRQIALYKTIRKMLRQFLLRV